MNHRLNLENTKKYILTKTEGNICQNMGSVAFDFRCKRFRSKYEDCKKLPKREQGQKRLNLRGDTSSKKVLKLLCQ